jgi:hypothetical protein
LVNPTRETSSGIKIPQAKAELKKTPQEVWMKNSLLSDSKRETFLRPVREACFLAGQNARDERA